MSGLRAAEVPSEATQTIGTIPSRTQVLVAAFSGDLACGSLLQGARKLFPPGTEIGQALEHHIREFKVSPSQAPLEAPSQAPLEAPSQVPLQAPLEKPPFSSPPFKPLLKPSMFVHPPPPGPPPDLPQIQF